MSDEINLENAHLYASDSRGVYIPQHFAESVYRDKCVGVSDEDYAILEAGPDHEWYWDTWDTVINNAELTGDDGVKYYLWQDGDLWLVPKDEVVQS